MLDSNKLGSSTVEALEEMAAALLKSGEYRVQRRLGPRRKIDAPPGTDLKLALFVDVETTGLNYQTDEIIELAMVPFTYGPDGTIYEVQEAFQRLRKPRKPISTEVTRLTGITNEMVEGRSIDPNEVEAFAEGAVLVIAHNAAFDRRFLEKLAPSFALKSWACSQTQIDWAAEGFDGTRLPHLVAGVGYFYEQHRATNDCMAGIELLASKLPLSGEIALSKLLQTARKPTWRIWAENSPFDLKEILKSRGYKWNPEGTPFPKAWFIDVSDEGKDAEVLFLQKEIYQREFHPLIRRIDPLNRFSDRI